MSPFDEQLQFAPPPPASASPTKPPDFDALHSFVNDSAKMDILDREDPVKAGRLREKARSYGISLTPPHVPQAPTPPTNPTYSSDGSFLDNTIAGIPRFLEKLKTENIDPLVSIASDSADQSWPERLTGFGPQITMLKSLGGMAKAVAGGDTSAIPVWGQAQSAIHDYANGDPAGGNASLLSLAAALFGDKVWKGANAPLRAVGEGMVEKNFPWEASTSLRRTGAAERSATTRYLIDNNVLNADTAQANIDRIGPQVRQLLVDAGNPQVHGMNVLGPLNDEILARAQSSLPDSAIGKLGELHDEFVRHNGIQMPVTDMHDMQKNTYRTLQGKGAYGDVPDASLQDEILANKLLAAGEKDEIVGAVPGVRDFQNDLHRNLTIREGLEYLEKTKPSYFQKILPWVMGAAATGAGGAMGLSHGPMVGVPALISGAALGHLTKEVMSHPSTAMRLGVVFSKAGMGRFGAALMAVPKTGAVDRDPKVRLQ